MINLRIADIDKVWENVISHLESLGYDRDTQLLPDLYDYIEKSGKIFVVTETTLDEAHQVGFDEGFSEGYQSGTVNSSQVYDEGFDAGYEEGMREGIRGTPLFSSK
jgi:flagellar biosynthesis/type III secretory pathway protein FliH